MRTVRRGLPLIFTDSVYSNKVYVIDLLAFLRWVFGGFLQSERGLPTISSKGMADQDDSKKKKKHRSKDKDKHRSRDRDKDREKDKDKEKKKDRDKDKVRDKDKDKDRAKGENGEDRKKHRKKVPL